MNTCKYCKAIFPADHFFCPDCRLFRLDTVVYNEFVLHLAEESRLWLLEPGCGVKGVAGRRILAVSRYKEYVATELGKGLRSKSEAGDLTRMYYDLVALEYALVTL